MGSTDKSDLHRTFENRQLRIEHECYKQRTQDTSILPDQHRNMKFIYVLDEGNFAWCPVYKAGSTTISNILVQVWNRTEVKFKLILKLEFCLKFSSLFSFLKGKRNRLRMDYDLWKFYIQSHLT